MTEQDSAVTDLTAAFLAGQGLTSGARAAPVPPPDLGARIRTSWESLEAEILAMGFTGTVLESDRNYPRTVRWDGRSVTLCDSGAAVAWREVPDGILAQHGPLLVRLRDAVKREKTRSGARLVAAHAQAAVAAQVEEARTARPAAPPRVPPAP